MVVRELKRWRFGAAARLCADAAISEVLSGNRKLNRTQIGKLARYFKVSPGAFAEPTHRP